MSEQAPETYKKVEVLGQGSFGKAFLVQCESDGVTASLIQAFRAWQSSRKSTLNT